MFASRRARSSLARVFFLLAALPSWLAADDFEGVREQIRKAVQDGSVPSLAVAVARDGKILWEQGFGWADREKQLPATEHTVYSLASISKPITATGLMVLVERGALQLDQPVNDYLGDVKLVARVGGEREATVRRLANHTSGLPLHYQFFYADEAYPLPAFDESLRRYGNFVNVPGEHYQYSNFGYGVLDHLCARMSGKSYADFMQAEVFAPLGLTRMAIGLPPELADQQAVRYGPDNQPLPFYDFDHRGGSAAYSSAHDLLRFGMFHLGQRDPEQKAILSEQSLQEMQKPTADAGNARYGVGWFIVEDEHGYRTVGHSGGMGGVRTKLTLVPSEKIAVVTLCNTGHDLPLQISKEILAVLLPEYGRKLKVSREPKPDKPSAGNPPSAGSPEPHNSPLTQLQGEWEGTIHTYRGERKLRLWVKDSGDVHVRVDRQLETLLNEPRFEKGLLTGVFLGDVGTEDANRTRYHLHLNMRLREQKLQGAVTAISLPAAKPGNALSHWTELSRVRGPGEPQPLFNGKDLAGWRIVDTQDFEQHGPVEVADGSLVIGVGQPASGVSYTGDLPRSNYELQLEAKRLEGSDFFCGLTFPVDSDYCTLILGGWGGGVTGLSNIDGMSAVENETTDYVDFQQDRWYHVRLRVTRDKLEVWLDQKQIVDLARKDHRFSIWWEQEPMCPLGIATWNTKAALRSIQVRRL